MAVALVLAVQIVRNAAVAGFATFHPDRAARVWAGHPDVEISRGLSSIGRASRDREPIDPAVFAMMDDAAAKSPMSPEPFLVRGVQEQVRGDLGAAERAFLAAQRRDPRSIPAAYFLASYYLQGRRPVQGLPQMMLLARLYPTGDTDIAPFIAAYAQDRSNWPAIRKLFRSGGTLEDRVLAELARDPRNSNAIFALADSNHRNSKSPWVRQLLTSLVASADYSRAHEIWSALAHGRQQEGQLIYDADFSAPDAPPPFNWSLASSAIGLAERQPGKRLHIIFYGNDDGLLAGELLLLPPGSYRLEMKFAGDSSHPELLSWSIRCDKSADPIASVGLDQSATNGWIFQVPPDCPAQWLELTGSSAEIAEQSEATITDLALSRWKQG